MNDDDVPVKTDEGFAEIKKRSMGLAPRIRTALLLVDGMKTISELIPILAAAGVQANALDILLEKGLIRLLVPRRVAPASIADPLGEALQTLSPQELPTVIRELLQKESAPSEKAIALEAAAPVTIKPASVPETVTMPAPAAELPPAQANSEPAAKQTPQQEKPQPAPAKLTKTPKIPNPATQTKPAPSVPAGPEQLPVVSKAAPSILTVPAPTPTPARKKVVRGQDTSVRFMSVRAHLASALDEHADIQGYILRQRLMACANFYELEVLFGEIEKTLSAVLNNSKVLEIMKVAKAALQD